MTNWGSYCKVRLLLLPSREDITKWGNYSTEIKREKHQRTMDFGSQLLDSALTYMPVNRQFAPRNS